MECRYSQQSPEFSERTLDKQEIHRILEGLFMQQVMELLGPCFKTRRTSTSDDRSCSSQMVDLSSPSESIPEIVGAVPEIVGAVAQSDEVLNLDFLMSEISQRIGRIFVV
jgi:hypothetical protein